MDTNVTMATYNRLPIYLKALHYMQKEGAKYVSSVSLAQTVRENPSVVKSDLSCAITCVGKPKVGYEINRLIDDIENFLGYNNAKDAILVGVGKLGQALMGYSGFAKYGLNIIAGFDIDDSIIGKTINGKEILPTGKIEGAVEKLGLKIAILCTQADHAQIMADTLVNAGIRAIWNFTGMHLNVPENIMIKNEDLAANLAILAIQLKETLKKENN